MAWQILTPGVVHALSMGEHPRWLPLLNVAGEGRDGKQDKILSTRPHNVAKDKFPVF